MTPAPRDFVSRTARELLTLENDENAFGLDAVLALADDVPVVLDLHHHWVESRDHYIEPDDPRIARVRASWREMLLDGHAADTAPDFCALSGAGHTRRDPAAHSNPMWNRAVNAIVARHLAWADFEIEANGRNIASPGIAEQIKAGAPLSAYGASVQPVKRKNATAVSP